jgi:hypothetical protein
MWVALNKHPEESLSELSKMLPTSTKKSTIDQNMNNSKTKRKEPDVAEVVDCPPPKKTRHSEGSLDNITPNDDYMKQVEDGQKRKQSVQEKKSKSKKTGKGKK